MGRKPHVPAELTRRPFTTDEARRAGLCRWHLEGASWRRLGSGTYVWAGLTETPAQRLGLAEDNMRQNRLLDAGVRLLRFTAGDVTNNPDSILMQVRAMLSRPT